MINDTPAFYISHILFYKDHMDSNIILLMG